MTSRECKACGLTKPLDTDHFYFRKDNQRFRYECKECWLSRRRYRYTHDDGFRSRVKAHRSTPEFREKTNAQLRARYAKDEAFREQKKESSRRTLSNPEYRKGQLEKQKYKYHNDLDYRQNILARQRTPEAREKKNARSRNRLANDPLHRERILSKAMERYHGDPVHRERLLARKRTPEARSRKNAQRNERWANDPEYREEVSLKNKAIYLENPRLRERVQERNFVRKFGTTIVQREWMKLAQGGRCAICGQEAKLKQDHNHETGSNRDFLCQGCNVGIGFFAEDIKVLMCAIEYLNRPGMTPEDIRPMSPDSRNARFEIPHWEAQSRDENFRKEKSRNLKRGYGITIDQYEGLLAEGGGVCWICLRPETQKRRANASYPDALYVDHQHSTGWFGASFVVGAIAELRGSRTTPNASNWQSLTLQIGIHPPPGLDVSGFSVEAKGAGSRDCGARKYPSNPGQWNVGGTFATLRGARIGEGFPFLTATDGIRYPGGIGTTKKSVKTVEAKMRLLW